MKKPFVGVLSLGLMLSAHVPSSVPVAVAQSAGVIERASVESNGIQSNDSSFRPSISADGRYVAFGSQATNLVSGDTNSVWDIFVRDREASQTLRVSVSSGGAQVNQRSFDPQISGDGRYVTFTSIASNLAAGDTNNHWDIFVRSVQSGATTRVSVADDEAQANSQSLVAAISGDGHSVAFESLATNLVAVGTMQFRNHVFVRDWQQGRTELISVSSDCGADRVRRHGQHPARRTRPDHGRYTRRPLLYRDVLRALAGAVVHRRDEPHDPMGVVGDARSLGASAPEPGRRAGQ
jgi:hypothetical protein